MLSFFYSEQPILVLFISVSTLTLLHCLNYLITGSEFYRTERRVCELVRLLFSQGKIACPFLTHRIALAIDLAFSFAMKIAIKNTSIYMLLF